MDVHLTRRPGVPGHMVVDSASEHLYISDTGKRRGKKWRQKKEMANMNILVSYIVVSVIILLFIKGAHAS